MPLRKRRYGLDCQRLSVRLKQDTYDRLLAAVPRGQRSAFIDRATDLALKSLAGVRDTHARRALVTTARRNGADGLRDAHGGTPDLAGKEGPI